jgi:putative SOS response-associated peptidase YedK
MCGRYTQYSDAKSVRELVASMGATCGPWPTFTKRYNIAPTQLAWVLVGAATPGQQPLQLSFAPMAFGFRPKFMDHGVINARAETVEHKPMFRRGLMARRCLILASGFYEWAKGPGSLKQPYHFTLADKRPFVFAGLYRRIEAGDVGAGHAEAEFVIITTAANACVAPVHGRMPVLLDPDAARLWAEPQTPLPALTALLQPYPAQRMVAVPVRPDVNRPSHDAEDCIEPLPT